LCSGPEVVPGSAFSLVQQTSFYMPIKLLCVGYYCSIFARWWIKWITKIRVSMACSAYTCLDVC